MREKEYRALAVWRFCVCNGGWHGAAFFTWLDERRFSRAYLCRQRIDVGTHENFVFPDALFCVDTISILPKRIPRLLVDKAHRSSGRRGECAYIFLHVQRRVWRVARLVERRILFSLRWAWLFCRMAALSQAMGFTEWVYCRYITCRDSGCFCRVYVRPAAVATLSRPIDQDIRFYKITANNFFSAVFVRSKNVIFQHCGIAFDKRTAVRRFAL